MMSHELRTPLNAILGFTEIMTAETFGALGSPRYRQYLLDIKASGERLLGNINTILDLSKIDSGNMDLHDDLILPRDLAALPLRLLAGMAQKTGVALTGEIPEDVPAIRGDARLMEQALTNLLSNAIKASHRGGAVTLSAGCEADGGVVLRVSDQGIGMSAEEVEIALTPFGQVSTGHARRHEGTGLGLPLTKRIVEKHGGRLAIDSTPGAGTSIAIHLPADRVVALTALTEARRATA
jgi:signal transduction histidine kinase